MGIPMVAFDTLKFANRLKLVGVDPKQAEAEAEIFSEIFELNFRELVTKEDFKQLKEDLKRLENTTKEDLKREIAGLRKDIDARFELQRKDIDAKIEKSKFDLIKWVIGLLIAQSGLILTILRFFPKTGV